jgi:hypothetical protein
MDASDFQEMLECLPDEKGAVIDQETGSDA